jgi:imidazolonepropionase-like amidohydrolase
MRYGHPKVRIGRKTALLLSLATILAQPGVGAAQKRDKRDQAEKADKAEAARGPVRDVSDPRPSTYRPLPRADTIITNATILDGDGNRIDGGEILLRDGKVVAIGKRIEDRAGATEVDAKGRWITPGIIDVHSHNGTFVLPLTDIDNKSSDVSELSDANTADIWIEDAVNTQDIGFIRALAAGVTTLQILPGSSPIFAGHSVIVKPIPANSVAAMKFPGAKPGFKMACGENPKSQGASSGRGVTSRAGELAYIRRAFHEAQPHRRRGGGGRGGPPPGRDPRKEALAGIIEGEVTLHVHCYRADDMAAMIALSRELGFRIASFQHAVEAYKLVPLLKQEGICTAVWADWWGFKMEALDAVRANAPMLEAGGVCTMMHSDSPVVGQRLPLEAAKAAGAGRRMGIDVPPEQLVTWVTRNPARLLGLADRIGTLAPGRNADLVLWSGNPFSVYTKADLVFIDGAVAFDRSDPSKQPRSDFELGRRELQR